MGSLLAACCCGNKFFPLLSCGDDSDSGKTITQAAAASHVAGDVLKLDDGVCYYLGNLTDAEGEDVSTAIDSWMEDCETCCTCPEDSPTAVTVDLTFECPIGCPHSGPAGNFETATFAATGVPCHLTGKMPDNPTVPPGPQTNCLEFDDGTIVPSYTTQPSVTLDFIPERCGWKAVVDTGPACCDACLYVYFKPGTSPLGAYPADPTVAFPTSTCGVLAIPCRPYPTLVVS